MNVTKDLNTLANIPRKLNERLNILHLDPIDIITNDYKEHLSILKINQHLDIFDIFDFKNVNEIQIDNRIKEMN